jgi:hypothetical protein
VCEKLLLMYIALTHCTGAVTGMVLVTAAVASHAGQGIPCYGGGGAQLKDTFAHNESTTADHEHSTYR